MNRSNGFTMIELVTVLFVIAVLVAISVPMGVSWIATHRFTAMVRTFPNAVLMARIRGIQNRSVFAITSSQQITTSPFSSCLPGILFTTNVSHGLNPVPTSPSFSLSCPGNCSPTCDTSFYVKTPLTTQTRDTVMISGLDKHLSMNGVEFEVVTAPSPTTFAVQHAWSGLGDTASADTMGVVRNVTAPGRLTIFPATAVNTTPTNNNQENFSASDFTVKEEGASIVFRYNVVRFNTTVDGQLLDTSSCTSAQFMFDSRGFPQYVQTSTSPVPFVSVATVYIAEIVPAGEAKAPRQVTYKISPSGKVDTLASY